MWENGFVVSEQRGITRFLTEQTGTFTVRPNIRTFRRQATGLGRRLSQKSSCYANMRVSSHKKASWNKLGVLVCTCPVLGRLTGRSLAFTG